MKLLLSRIALTAALMATLAAPSHAADTSDVVGEWQIVSQVADGAEIKSTLIIQDNDGLLGGKIKTTEAEIPLNFVTYTNGALTCGFSIQNPNGGNFTGQMNGIPSKDQLQGTGNFTAGDTSGTFNFSGKRTRSLTSRDVLGTWSLESKTQDGESHDSMLVISPAGKGLTGEIIGELGQFPLSNVTYTSGVLAFDIEITGEQGEVYLIKTQGDIGADALTGQGTMGLKDAAEEGATFTVTGKRIAKPKIVSNQPILGKWNLSVQLSADQIATPVLTMTENAGQLAGTYVSERIGEFPASNIRWDGKTLVFTIIFKIEEREIASSYVLNLNEGKLDGDVEFDFQGRAGKLPVAGMKAD